MKKNKQNNIALFGTVKILAFAALMSSLSGILKFLAPTGDTWRISIENLPIIFSGIVLGPFSATAVGIAADLLGCLFRGFAINPMITLASAVVGFVSGVVFKIFGKKKILGIVFATFFAHILGNVIIKSFALSALFGVPISVVLLKRAGVYLLTSIAEILIIVILYRNNAIRNSLKRVIDK